MKQVAARAQPSRSSKVVATLDDRHGDATQNVVLLLDGVDVQARPDLVPRPAADPAEQLDRLGAEERAREHLRGAHASLRGPRDADGDAQEGRPRDLHDARRGRASPYWPTPAGQFYIRDKLTNFNNPFYGPLAFGTSARSAVLTDWPGGGFMGVHGTNEPDLIPGYISHGCIRMANDAIVKLAKLMTVGYAGHHH